VTTSSLIAPVKFYETGAHVGVGLALDWAIDDNVSLLLTGRNLTDANYQLVDGFPEAGRSLSVSLRLRN
jgi:iron complex outermembrane receptor protein